MVLNRPCAKHTLLLPIQCCNGWHICLKIFFQLWRNGTSCLFKVKPWLSKKCMGGFSTKLAEKYTSEIAAARLLTTLHSLLLSVNLKRFSKVRIITFTSITAAWHVRRLRARVHLWRLRRCVAGGIPLRVQVCARAKRTGTGSKYTFEDGFQNGKLLRGMEGEGEGERERDVEVPRQARWLTTPE